MLRLNLALFILLLTGGRTQATEATDWIEAEDGTGNLPRATWFAPANDTERSNLSGGDWLACDEPNAGVTVTWPFTSAGGDLVLWQRRGNGGGVSRWRVDAGEWHDAQPDARAWDSVPLDIRDERYLGCAWLSLGPLTLSAGAHRLEVELGKGRTIIDCFSFLPRGRRPYGIQRPGAPPPPAPPGWFAYSAPDDAADCSVDLRGLNPAHAGDEGPLEARGDALVSAKTGKAVRLWGASVLPEIGLLPDDALADWARRLARRGVNFVRIHVAPFTEDRPGPRTRAVQRVVAACAQQGIVVMLNWHCTAVDGIPEDWAADDGLKPKDGTGALHLFYPPYQERYRHWVKTLLTAPDTDGRPPLGQNPALVIIELADEDNFFWWSFNPGSYPEAVRAVLEKKFGDWCSARYGSAENALTAWGTAHPPKDLPDQPSKGRLALYPAMFLGGADWMTAQRDQKRAEDEARFLVETTRSCYAGMRGFLRDECRWSGLLIGTNWQSVDDRVVGPLDHFANSACEVMAHNTYFGGPLETKRFFPWMVGDVYADRSLLRDPVQGILMQMQLEGHPFILTEGGWEMPNRFRTEGPLTLACYASLQGIDGLCPFVCEESWDSHLDLRWPIAEPGDLGQYPAAAIIYRKAYVAEAPVVLRDALRLEDLFHLKGSALGAPIQIDSVRAGAEGGAAIAVDALPGIDPLAFFVGRVVRAIADDPGKPLMLPDLAAHIDRAHSTVSSATGQLTLRWDVGLLSIDAPCAQGAVGFLSAAGETRTHDARFALDNEYGSVVIVSLDGEPLSRSSRMLLQVMTEQRNHGWATEEIRHRFGNDGPEIPARRITSVGGTPIEVREVHGTVSLLREDSAQLTVTALDPGLQATHRVGTADRITLEPTVLAYLLHR
jgi:hypothetical protein